MFDDTLFIASLVLVVIEFGLLLRTHSQLFDATQRTLDLVEDNQNLEQAVDSHRLSVADVTAQRDYWHSQYNALFDKHWVAETQPPSLCEGRN